MAPEAVAALAPTAADASGCYTPKFTVVGTPVAPFRFAGVVSGDLEGTFVTQFDPASMGFAGVTISNSGVTEWTITGGVIPGLTEFETTFNNRNIDSDRPGSSATVFENSGAHRALSGVSKANLTYTGAFSALPTPQVVLQYTGVICR